MDFTASKNWKKTKLGDVAEIIGGGTPSTTELTYWDGNIPWITPKDLSGHQSMYIEKGERGITEEGVKNSSVKMLPKNSILFSSRAPIGYIAINKVPVTTNQGFKSLIPKEGNDYKFLYYWLSYNKDNIEKQASGSTFAEVSGLVMKNIEISLPESVDEQKEIAAMLGSLDDKIELLRVQNKTLESMAQTLFKEWFVDFRFPGATGKMIDSELGKIPEGWRVGKLGDIAEITSGKRPTEIFERKTKNSPYPLLGATSITGYVNSFLFDREIFVIGRVGTHGQIQRISEKVWPSDNTLVLSSKYPEYLHQILKNINFEVLNKGAVQPLITQGDIKSFLIFVSEDNVLIEFERAANSLSQKIKNNNLEIQTLSKTRDDLLEKIFN